VANIDTLVNNTFRVLGYLYDMRDKNNLVRVTQNEISQELDLNRKTVNTAFKTLKENGYIIHDETRVGRYYLTDSGVKTVELFRKSEK